MGGGFQSHKGKGLGGVMDAYSPQKFLNLLK